MENRKQAIITGASSGIGAALAESLARRGGWRLHLLGRDHARLEQVAAQCNQSGAEVHTHVADVTDADAMQRMLAAIQAQGPVDLVIANAGISGGSDGGAEKTEQMRRIINVNLLGVINSIQPLLPHMIAQGRGRIAIISSLAGFRGLSTAPAYSTSKVAARAYGEALAPMLAKHGITVTTVCPGFIKTPMTDVNPFPMPFLMSAEKAAGYMLPRILNGNRLIAFPLPMALAARILALLPRAIGDRLIARMPNKTGFE
ncbi:SDR family NAD(P)-dependent oxidoreductase [bacterium]|nr:SDR family NAD(P)-dependent oxidoreductase [bacterium]